MPTLSQHVYSASNPAPSELRFRAGTSAFAKSISTNNVDIPNRKLNNCLLCTVGEAEGWGINIEASFISDLVTFAKTQKNGIKSNLMHNYENMGYQLGKITNIQIDGDSARGDLSIYKAADKSPRAPGMGEWLLDLIQEDPEAAMMSICVQLAYYYQKNDMGAEVKVWEYDPDNGWISPNSAMPIYAKFGSLESCDVVAEGALTEAMFSHTPITTTQQSHWLKDFARTIQKLIGFHSGPDEIDDNIRKQAPPVNPILELSKSDTDMTKEEAAEFSKQIDEKFLSFSKQLETAETDNQDLKKELEAAKATNEKISLELATAKEDIKKLDASAADTHADGQKDTGKSVKILGFGKNTDALKALYDLP
jgi:regulator of replication initiation timing